VPLFRQQLANGGPLTVTHPEMQRYFMTVREAVSLVLQASAAGSGEEPIEDGGIFTLDMGEPIKIVDLARQMIRLAGLRPDIDIAVQFTGLRPGEKLFEELFHGGEAPSPTDHPGLLMASPRTADLWLVSNALRELENAVLSGDTRAALKVLARMVPEFDHNITGSETGLAVFAGAR
jgi:O-antigen biosynthesis protein WbqV